MSWVCHPHSRTNVLQNIAAAPNGALVGGREASCCALRAVGLGGSVFTERTWHRLNALLRVRDYSVLSQRCLWAHGYESYFFFIICSSFGAKVGGGVGVRCSEYLLHVVLICA